MIMSPEFKLCLVAPAADRAVQTELIEQTPAELAQQIVHAVGAGVKGGHKGHDDGPGGGKAAHIVQMNEIQGRFPGDDDERAAFLEGHVGGPVQEVDARAAGNGGKAAHGAGADDHAVVPPGTAGRSGGQIVRGMDRMGAAGEIGGRKTGFFPQHDGRARGNDEMQFHIGPLQALEQTARKRHAACSADADDQSSLVGGLLGHHGLSAGEGGLQKAEAPAQGGFPKSGGISCENALLYCCLFRLILLKKSERHFFLATEREKKQVWNRACYRLISGD